MLDYFLSFLNSNWLWHNNINNYRIVKLFSCCYKHKIATVVFSDVYRVLKPKVVDFKGVREIEKLLYDFHKNWFTRPLAKLSFFIVANPTNQIES
jgi:hypothetical protein